MATYYKFGPCTPTLLKHDGSKCEAETSSDGKYVQVKDNTYVFCYYESFETGNTFLPCPKHVSMNNMLNSSSTVARTVVNLPKAVFNVLTPKGRQLLVCDDPGLLDMTKKVQLLLTSSTTNSDHRTEDKTQKDKIFEFKIPARITPETNLLMSLHTFSSSEEQIFRKNQFIMMIESDLAKYGIQFWTDIHSFRPDPVIDADTTGKYHPYPKSKVDLFFMPIKYYKCYEIQRQIGVVIQFCDTLCHHHDPPITGSIHDHSTGTLHSSTQSANHIYRAMKEALIMGTEVVTYALTHDTPPVKVVDVYLMLMSMKIDKAQILHMELEFSNTREYRPVYRLSSTEKRCTAFNKLMNFYYNYSK